MRELPITIEAYAFALLILRQFYFITAPLLLKFRENLPTSF